MSKIQQNDQVVAGQRLGNALEYAIGNNVYCFKDGIYASLTGSVKIKKQHNNSKSQISIVGSRSTNSTPSIGSVILGKVSRVTPVQANVDILALSDNIAEDGRLFIEPYKGVLRKQDVRLHNIDQVVMSDCFRPDDVIRAEIISFGDSRSYYLSTAKNEYGVVYARSSDSDAVMQPISWQSMQCTKSGMIELRKCAKPLDT
ncbi:hypothetical protein MP228_000641 [Amoeboaphelidium protococcarum]|nr:hypothetical protein MP228_000641 [Amoeboaphelidium protococcarum]